MWEIVLWLLSQSVWVKVFGLASLGLTIVLLIVLVLRRNSNHLFQKLAPAALRWMQSESAFVRCLATGAVVLFVICIALAAYETASSRSQVEKSGEVIEPAQANTNRLTPDNLPTAETTIVEQSTSGECSPAVNVGRGDVQINQQCEPAKQTPR